MFNDIEKVLKDQLRSFFVEVVTTTMVVLWLTITKSWWYSIQFH